jgi:PLP dependent protein
VVDSQQIRDRLAEVRRTIASACAAAGRRPDDVIVVAVTKTVPAARIAAAQAEGIRDFGENYAKDLAAKAAFVPGRWHFVGKLQRGTASRVADWAEVIQSAEPGGAVARVAARAAAAGRTIDCLIQVDFTGRRQGAPPDQDALRAFLAELDSMEGVRPTGLMTVPPQTADPEGARPFFARLRTLRDALGKDWPHLTELSMGMSADYPVAVEEGATMVRLGTALFGERPRQAAGPTHSGRTGGGPEGRPEA